MDTFEPLDKFDPLAELVILDSYYGILNDRQIMALCSEHVEQPMLVPFVDRQVSKGIYKDFLIDYNKPWTPVHPNIENKEIKIISYGVSSFGYDCRLAPEYKVFTNTANDGGVIDPLDFREDAYVTKTGPWCVIPPNSYILGTTIETFYMPQEGVSVCLGKSTYARAGIAINVTPIEPGFVGQVTLEISNQTPLPIKVYANMGICQFLFFKGLRPLVTYSDKKGKYMGQKGITPPRV